MKLNPFFRVIEIPENPLARVYRTNFLEKLSDTFYIIAGNRAALISLIDRDNIDEVAKEEHPGILDYATFQAARTVNKLTYWCFQNIKKEPIALLFIVPTTIISIVINPIHYFIAAVATFVISPIVLAVHIFSELFGGYRLKAQAKALKGAEITSGEHKQTKIYRDVNSFLHKTGHTFSDIVVDLENEVEFHSEPNNPRLLFMEGFQKYQCCIDDGYCSHQKGHVKHEVSLTNLNEQDKKSLRALLDLNAGSLYTNLKKRDRLEQFKADIDYPIQRINR